LSKFLLTNVLAAPLTENATTLNGFGLEKWALKTFLNLGYIRGLRREQTIRLDPTAQLIRYIFRNETIADGVGLYFVTGKLSSENYQGGLWWDAIQNPANPAEIFGMAFTFYGIRFVISIPPLRAESKIAGLGLIKGFDYSSAKIIYPPSNVSFRSGTAGMKRINLQW